MGQVPLTRYLSHVIRLLHDAVLMVIFGAITALLGFSAVTGESPQQIVVAVRQIVEVSVSLDFDGALLDAALRKYLSE